MRASWVCRDRQGLHHWVAWCVVLVCVVGSLTGCDSFGRKFVRKRKPQPQVQRVLFQDEMYEQKTDAERYSAAYVRWQAWQGELRKPREMSVPYQQRAATHAADSLQRMFVLLPSDIAAPLERYVQHLQQYQRALSLHKLSIRELNKYVSRMEKIFRVVRRDYTPAKMAVYLNSGDTEQVVDESSAEETAE